MWYSSGLTRSLPIPPHPAYSAGRKDVVDKRKAWREQEQQLVQNWNAAAHRYREIMAQIATENPLGAMGYYVVSKGDLVPFRVKIRSASFNNVSITPWLLKGVYVPDIITILASLYFILGDIDR